MKSLTRSFHGVPYIINKREEREVLLLG